MLGFSESFETTENTKLNPVEIPNGYIIEREIKKAVTGLDFFYNDNETGKPVYLKGLTFTEFYYYYIIWEDFNILKTLPHGQGTLQEKRWVLDTIKFFEKANTQIENMLREQDAKRGNNG